MYVIIIASDCYLFLILIIYICMGKVEAAEQKWKEVERKKIFCQEWTEDNAKALTAFHCVFMLIYEVWVLLRKYVVTLLVLPSIPQMWQCMMMY